MMSYIKFFFIFVLLLIIIVLVAKDAKNLFHNSKGVCPLNESYEVDNATILSNKSLLYHDRVFGVAEYFKDNDNKYRICPKNICSNRTCVKKCCPPKNILMDNNCLESDDANLSLDLVQKQLMSNTSNGTDLEFHYGAPSCDEGHEITKFSIELNGSLTYKTKEGKDEVTSHSIYEYCLDLTKDNGTSKYIFTSFICFLDFTTERSPKPAPKQKAFEYYGYFVVASIIFFLLTLIVYTVVPEVRGSKRGLHGLCLMCHIACLTVAFTALAFTYFGSNFEEHTCKLIGYSYYYGLMSGFLWLNVMCYDMWRNFDTSKPITFITDKMRRIRKFIFYSIYAYGIPAVLSLIMYAIDNNVIEVEYDYRPDVGNANRTCSINSKEALWIYLYGPLMIILVVNSFLFIVTVIQVRTALEQINKSLKDKDCCRAQKKQIRQLKLYAKLFMVMGASWIMEIVSYYFANDTSEIWWYPTDIINSSRGAFIFYIFILKKKVLRKLNQKFCPSVTVEIGHMGDTSMISSSSSNSRQNSRKSSVINRNMRKNLISRTSTENTFMLEKPSIENDSCNDCKNLN